MGSYRIITNPCSLGSRGSSVRLQIQVHSPSKVNILMRHYRLVQVCFLALTAVTQGVVFAQSQANTGTIEGIVSDPSGRAVAVAQVTVTNLGTNFTRALLSDAEGRFRGLLLPLGPYKVTVKAPNFGTLVREGLDLAVPGLIAVPAHASWCWMQRRSRS